MPVVSLKVEMLLNNYELALGVFHDRWCRRGVNPGTWMQAELNAAFSAQHPTLEPWTTFSG